ncbi:MAG: hypothetical protein ABJL34_18845 [Kangiellaceae bacterium]
MKPYVVLFLTYAFLLILKWAFDKKEFRRCPEKGERYKILPLHFKFGCWFIVVPLLALGTVGPFVFEDEPYALSFLLSIVAFAFLEVRVVEWYRKNGYY